jgi:UDP-perosamine 4-acetyltransferase
MTSPRSVIVIGAGGHARVVADALLCAGANVLGFTDADTTLWGRAVIGLPVLGGDEVLARHDAGTVALVNGLGMIDARSATLRRRVQEGLSSQGWTFTAVRHPSAIVSPRARLASDVQVLAGAVIQTGASVGAGTIINTRAVIEHDANLGDWSHVAPGAVICGDVRIGCATHVGAGATVRQGLCVGARCVIGIGAAVVSDQSDDACAVGVPARPFESKQ